MEELVRCGADTFVRVGTCGGMQVPVLRVAWEDDVPAHLAGGHLDMVESVCVLGIIFHNLVAAAKEKGFDFHTGVVQCKDSFYGQHEPEVKPVSYVLHVHMAKASL